jgi:hypothetical protein
LFNSAEKANRTPRERAIELPKWKKYPLGKRLLELAEKMKTKETELAARQKQAGDSYIRHDDATRVKLMRYREEYCQRMRSGDLPYQEALNRKLLEIEAIELNLMGHIERQEQEWWDNHGIVEFKHWVDDYMPSSPSVFGKVSKSHISIRHMG